MTLARWQRGNSTEREIISAITDTAELVQRAVAERGHDAISAHLCHELPRLSTHADPCVGEAWTAAGYTSDDVQAALIAAASGGTGKKGRDKSPWFKREDAGESLGEFIHQHWNRYRATHLGGELTKVREFIYGADGADFALRS